MPLRSVRLRPLVPGAARPAPALLLVALGACLAAVLTACGGDVAPRPETLSASDGGADTTASAAGSRQAAYDFGTPAARFELPGELDEISGITVRPDGRLAAVQDEKGNVYVLDPATGEVVSEHDFAGDGDYEDLAFARDELYILRSDGRLYRVTESRGDNWDTDDTDLDLPKGCDAEGLAYDAGAHRLLVGCKETIGLRRTRGVFAYDLDREALAAEPAYTLSLDELEGAVALDGRGLRSPRNVKPSALGVHPQTGDLYVLSSVETAIVVLAPDGTLIGTYALPDDVFRQPEGLAFAPDGTLYLTSEAAGRDAVLARFDPRP